MPTKKLEDVIEEAGFVWQDRLTARDLPFDERDPGKYLSLQALSSDHITYLISKSRDEEGKFDEGTASWWTCKFGIRGIHGVYNKEGVEVKLEFDLIPVFHRGNIVEVVKDEYLKRIPAALLKVAEQGITTLTNLSEAEIDKLDFFTRPESNATSTQKEVSKKTSKTKSENLEVISTQPEES